MTAKPERRLVFGLGALFTATVLGYATWAAFFVHPHFHDLRAGVFGDSLVDIRAAHAPLWSLDFLAAHRSAPFGFLLLIKLCGYNLRAITLTQSTLAIVAWTFLARTVGALLRETHVRIVGVAVVLLVGLSPTVLLWNATILTESLGLSCLAVALALWIRVATGEGRRAFVGLAAALVALACVRDTNDYALFLVAIIATGLAMFRPHLRRCAATLAGVCLVASVVNIGLAARAQRWYVPLTHVVAYRALKYTSMKRYFIARGMPHDAVIQNLRIKVSLLALANSPRYAAFRSWILHDGRSAYLHFLITHPHFDASVSFKSRNALLAPRVLSYASLFHDEPLGVFRAIGAIAFPGSPLLVEVWLVGACGAGLVLWRRGIGRPLMLALGLAGFLAVPGYVTAWFGDALELDRHSLTAAVELRLVLWIVTLVLVDRVARRYEFSRLRSARRGDQPTPSPRNESNISRRVDP